MSACVQDYWIVRSVVNLLCVYIHVRYHNAYSAEICSACGMGSVCVCVQGE